MGTLTGKVVNLTFPHTVRRGFGLGRDLSHWFAAAATSLLLMAPTASAQQSQLERFSKKPEQVAESTLGFGQGSIVVAPIPLSNPTIGSGLILGAGYMFQADEGSSTSVFGAAAMRTNNGSEAAAAGASLHFGDNRWNLLMLGGAARVFYDLYGQNADKRGPLQIDQEALIGRVRLAYGFTEQLSLGVEAVYLDTKLSNPQLRELVDPVLPDFGIRIRQVAYGPTLTFDAVDDTIYPTRGIKFNYTGQHGQGLQGFHTDFWKNVTIGSGYVPLGDRVVVAGKLTACSISSGAPFYNLCVIGGTDGFRGYAVGQYLGHALGSAQGAVRFRFGERWGGALFAGAGSVADSTSGLSDAARLRAGGAGIRFRLSKKFPLDFAVDAAVNADEDVTTYVRVGQAF